LPATQVGIRLGQVANVNHHASLRRLGGGFVRGERPAQHACYHSLPHVPGQRLGERQTGGRRPVVPVLRAARAPPSGAMLQQRAAAGRKSAAS
jgi:hypothetical protein